MRQEKTFEGPFNMKIASRLPGDDGGCRTEQELQKPKLIELIREVPVHAMRCFSAWCHNSKPTLAMANLHSFILIVWSQADKLEHFTLFIITDLNETHMLKVSLHAGLLRSWQCCGVCHQVVIIKSVSRAVDLKTLPDPGQVAEEDVLLLHCPRHVSF